MYPFPQSASPALRSHIDAHTAFINELSQTMSRSFQQVFQLNLQLGQTLLEGLTSTTQRMLSTGQPTDALSAAATSAQPVADKLRAYQQQLSQLAAATQVDLTRVTEHHVQETSRTAHALAGDVTRATAEETRHSLQKQEDAIKNSREALAQETERGAKAAGSVQGGGNAQPAGKTPSAAR